MDIRDTIPDAAESLLDSLVKGASEGGDPPLIPSDRPKSGPQVLALGLLALLELLAARDSDLQLVNLYNVLKPALERVIRHGR